MRILAAHLSFAISAFAQIPGTPGKAPESQRAVTVRVSTSPNPSNPGEPVNVVLSVPATEPGVASGLLVELMVSSTAAHRWYSISYGQSITVPLYWANMPSLPPGRHSIHARLISGANTPVSQAFTDHIVRAPAPSMTITPPPRAPFGTPVPIEVAIRGTAGPPPGRVTFTRLGSTVGSAGVDGVGVARLNLTGLPGGSHVLLAAYEPSQLSPYPGVASTTVVDVTPVATSVTLAPNLTEAAPGQVVRFTAAVRWQGGPAGGEVQLRDGGRLVAARALDATGTAAFEVADLPPGLRQVTAVFAGTASFSAAASETVAVRIRPPVTIVSAASGVPAAAPESIVALFGTALADSSAATLSRELPERLAGRRVTVRDRAGVERAAGLYFVGPAQINFVMPAGSAPGLAQVQVRDETAIVASGEVRVEALRPALFTAAGNGAGPAAAVVVADRPDGTRLVWPVFECPPGAACRTAAIDLTDAAAVLQLFATGVRAARSGVFVRFGDREIEAAYSGPQAEYPGLDQINVPLPRSLAGAGEVALQIRIGETRSNAAAIRFR